jgi:hypothetical protein
MTPEDLKQARLHLWHQDGTPILTTEEVRTWLDEIGFCSLLPGTHPLASLAQATAGSEDATPDQAAQSAARQITAQLLQDRSAVPLLWDENSPLTGEQFDAVASVEVLPYLYCLRGDRDLKKAPTGSPLVQAVWQALQEGAKSVSQIVTAVGRELTEAAVLRALRELWVKLRVVPVLETHASDEGAMWDLLQRLYPAAVKQGAGMSQPLAVSAMVSVYLGGSVAATADEVEDALGPLASRSRVREVLNALQATRQLKMFPVGRSSAYALAGGSAEVLDEIAEKRDTDALKVAKAEAFAKKDTSRSPREFGERKAWAKDKGIAARTRTRPPANAADASGDKPAGGERTFKPRSAEGGFAARNPAARKPFVKREGAGGERKEWKPRPASGGFAARGGERKPWVKRDAGEAPRKPFVKREGAAGERKEWKPRAAGAGAGAGFAARKPYVKRDAGDGPPRKPFVKREGAAGERKEWKPRAAGAGAGFAARKPFVKRDSGDYPARKPFVKREGAGGERKEWNPRAGAGAGFGGRKPFGKKAEGNYPPRAPRPERPAGERREWKDRPTPGGATGERKPFVKREGVGDKRFDRKPFGAKPGGKSFGGPKKFGAKPFGAKPFGAKPFGSKPGGKTFAKKPFGAKPFGSKPGAPAKRTYKRKDEEA